MQSGTRSQSSLKNMIDELLKKYFLVPNLPIIEDVEPTGYSEENYLPVFDMGNIDENTLERLKKSNPEPLALASAYQQIGHMYYNRGLTKQHHWDFKEALDYYRIGLSTSLEYISKNSQSCQNFILSNEAIHLKYIARAVHYLGLIHDSLNQITNALEYYLIELKIRITFLEETKIKDRFIPNTCFYIGSIYFRLNDYEKSIDYYHYAWLIAKDHFNHFHPIVGKSLFQLALIYQHMGDCSLRTIIQNIKNESISYITIESARNNFQTAAIFFKSTEDFHQAENSYKDQEDLSVIDSARFKLKRSKKRLNAIEGKYNRNENALEKELIEMLNLNCDEEGVSSLAPSCGTSVQEKTTIFLKPLEKSPGPTGFFGGQFATQIVKTDSPTPEVRSISPRLKQSSDIYD